MFPQGPPNNESTQEHARRMAEHDKIWNAAIEAAANLVHDELGDPDDTFWIVQNIRKLKK